MHDSVFFFKAFVGLLAAPFILLSSLITPQKPQIHPGSMENYSTVPQETSTPVKNNLTSPMSGLEMTETGYQTTNKQISITPPPMAQTTTVNSDPKIDCVGPDGKHLQITQKECDDFNNAWKNPQNINCEIVPGQSITVGSREECNRAKSTFPAANTQKSPSSANNVYCWDNTNKVGYYTSSGDQCNKDNLSSTNYKACEDTQKSKLDGCSSQCKTQLEKDNGICAWAYTGQNATIAQNADKYGECLNGSGGSGETYGSCLTKCSDQYAQDLKQCH